MQRELPEARGSYILDFCLKDESFFRSGGNCEIYFSPADTDDLLHFVRFMPRDLRILPIGALSNSLVPSDGLPGCVINMKPLNKMEIQNEYIEVGGGALLSSFIRDCVRESISCLEEMYCIPGTIGGALIMNAGTALFSIADNLISVKCTDRKGRIHILRKPDLNMSYRNGNIPDDYIILSATLKFKQADSNSLNGRLREITRARQQTQPMGAQTCGSTFKNPQGEKAWQLIRASCQENLRVGGASISAKHANFIVNDGNASSEDVLALVLLIKKLVFERTGIMLEE
jgi:UDP-N-acetylmuramate dehydrogenase